MKISSSQVGPRGPLYTHLFVATRLSALQLRGPGRGPGRVVCPRTCTLPYLEQFHELVRDS